MPSVLKNSGSTMLNGTRIFSSGRSLLADLGPARLQPARGPVWERVTEVTPGTAAAPSRIFW